MVASRYGVGEENPSIWVYLEQEDGILAGVSLELLAKGRQLADQAGWQLAGLLLGAEVAHLAATAFAQGADQVWQLEHRLLKDFTVETYTQAAFQAILQGRPSIFLCGATPNGRDLAGRLAVRLRTGLNADCTGLRLDRQSGVLISEVSGFGGGILALIEAPRHRPQMATVRPGVFSSQMSDPKRKGELLRLVIELDESLVRTRRVEWVSGEAVDLTKAPVLVAGGRGMEGDFELLRELAELLGGEVGATRPPVDEGQIERQRQVGQTGVVCSPEFAICCGISGAFHFVVGIEKADTVIAINSDPDAPIFDYADYCVVGDVHQVIPALVAALKEERQAVPGG